MAAGRLDPAHKAYEQSLAIRERLAKADATNTQWQRDLSVSYMKLGALNERGGNRALAAVQFRKSLAISERLAALDPSNATWKYDLERVRSRLEAVTDPTPRR